ncbi:MAG: hypothetical protein M1827_006753 [Pycnora praestabilis]|nr:MAG: hypothetical protein M1827_006753 [Pycnora praestabilis]
MPNNYEAPPAFCEDYNSDDNQTLPGTRKSANVNAKRRTKTVRDGASDSGYSSRAATVTSSDSGGQKTSPARLKVDTALGSSKRRPSFAEPSTGSSRRSPSKDPQGTTSRAARAPDRTHPERCDCERCIRMYPSTTPLESPWDTNYYPFNRPSHSVFENSPSRQSTRPSPRGTTQEAPAIPGARPRLSASQPQRLARPVSYHAGAMPDPMMYMSSLYGSSYDRGPPPASSAYTNPPIIPQSYPPPGMMYAPSLTPTPPSHASQSPVDQPRPRPRHSTSDSQYTTRPTSIYGTPVVHDQATYGTVPSPRRATIREPVSAPLAEEYTQDEEYYRSVMPPPQTIPISRRPSVRHSATPSSGRDIHRQGAFEYPDAGVTMMPTERSRPSRPEESSRSRRPSLATSHDSGRKPSSYTNASDSAKITVGSSSRRRASYYGNERPLDLDRKQREAEAYQESFTKPVIPLTADALRAARRNNRLGSSSGSQSRASSSREGSEGKTRSGMSGIASRSETSEGITMRFNTNAGVKLDFAGDLEGRTITVKPGEDGLAELSIGGPGRQRPTYRARSSTSSQQLDYARSGMRVDADDVRRTRETRTTDRSSRRSSRSGYGSQV